MLSQRRPSKEEFCPRMLPVSQRTQSVEDRQRRESCAFPMRHRTVACYRAQVGGEFSKDMRLTGLTESGCSVDVEIVNSSMRRPTAQHKTKPCSE